MADLQGLLSSPMFNLGIGLLSTRGRPEGLLAGMNQLNRNVSASQNAQYQQAIMEQLKKKGEEEERQRRAQQQLPNLLATSQVPQGQIDATQGGLPTIGPQGQAFQFDQNQADMIRNMMQAYPGVAQEMIKNQVLPQQPKQTNAAQKLIEAGLVPGTPEFQKAMMDSIMKPQVSIDIAPKLPPGFQWKDPTQTGLGVEPIPGGPKEKGTGEQNKAAGFANRMTTSEIRMQESVGRGHIPGNVYDFYAQKLPLLGNFLTKDQAQVYRQAQEDWVRAKLRKESGAVIGIDEMNTEIETYFPQPGDKNDVVEAKAKAREEAIKGVVAESEGQFGRKFGEDNLNLLYGEKTVNTIQNDADYDKLPSGAVFVGPDGVTRVKP